jgi:hypothetical protein
MKTSSATISFFGALMDFHGIGTVTMCKIRVPGEQFITLCIARTFMTIRKARRKQAEKPFHELVTDLLFSAMANHEDFVVTYEINPATGKKEIHVMVGKLMNPDMLAALKNECDQQLEDGGRHHIRNME